MATDRHPRLNREHYTRLRNERGLLDWQVAQAAGIHPLTLSKAINGRPCFPDTVQKISRGLARFPVRQDIAGLLADEGVSA